MLMNSFDISFDVGLNDYHLVLNKPCSEDGTTPIAMRMSFCLWGDLMPAALHDDIYKTVDYDGLCEHIKAILDPFTCQQFSLMNSALKDGIRAFSPLISGGFLALSSNCHRFCSSTIYLA
jgi:hypothetical protein